jgi:hypothetical protein
MLDRIGEKYGCRIDADFAEELAQQRAGGPDEGMTRAIFLIAGRLADQHEPRSARPFAGHGLRCIPPQNAATARSRTAFIAG